MCIIWNTKLLTCLYTGEDPNGTGGTATCYECELITGDQWVDSACMGYYCLFMIRFCIAYVTYSNIRLQCYLTDSTYSLTCFGFSQNVSLFCVSIRNNYSQGRGDKCSMCCYAF